MQLRPSHIVLGHADTLYCLMAEYLTAVKDILQLPCNEHVLSHIQLRCSWKDMRRGACCFARPDKRDAIAAA